VREGGLRETEPYLSWRSPPGFSSSLPATQPGKGPRPWRPRGPPKATRSPASGAPPARLSFPKPPCSPSRSSCHTIPHRHILTPEPRMSCSCCCMCVCVCVSRARRPRSSRERALEGDGALPLLQPPQSPRPSSLPTARPAHALLVKSVCSDALAHGVDGGGNAEQAFPFSFFVVGKLTS